MSSIKLTLPDGCTAGTGRQVTFRAPCNSTEANIIKIGDTTYNLVDMLDQGSTDLTVDLFKSGSLVSVIIDNENHKAFVQTNAPTSITATSVQLTVDGWTSSDSAYMQTVTVTSVTALSHVIVTYAPDSRVAYIDADIYCSAQGEGTLTFMCETVPTEAVTANLIILG